MNKIEDENIVCECTRCDKPICKGERFYNIDGEPWCKKCINDYLSIVREGKFNGFMDYSIGGTSNENN